MRKKLALLLTSITLFLVSLMSYANEFPVRPIKILVPFNVGGGVDTYARALAQHAKNVIRAPIIIVNNPGASGLVAANKVMQARANGYTLMLTSSASLLLSSLTHKTQVSVFDSFSYIGQIGTLNTALIVPNSSPFTSVEQLISQAKATPERLRWAHAGRGGFHHIAGSGFLQKNNLSIQDVPFKGGGPARTALIGEQIDFGFIGSQQLKGFEQRLRVLAINSQTRDELMPHVPTFAELGIPFVDISSPIVIYAPRQTPVYVVEQLSTLVKKIVEQPEFKKTLKQKGLPSHYVDGRTSQQQLQQMLAELSPLISK